MIYLFKLLSEGRELNEVSHAKQLHFFASEYFWIADTSSLAASCRAAGPSSPSFIPLD
jgi:hypothetical protein